MNYNHILDNLNKNQILQSNLDNFMKNDPCVFGIDEAGRGPVLGPMVYGCAFYPLKIEKEILKLGFCDSKELTENKREELFEIVNQISNKIGWIVEILSPNYISNSMLKRSKYNLNSLSHDSAIGLINKTLDLGVNISHIYVDTVGPPEKYEDKLLKLFPNIKVKVSKKADSLYPVVSIASICAKVIRDYCVKNWKFLEKIDFKNKLEYGSGYPGDPKTKSFLNESFDKIFGFPNLIRFSWSTANNIIEKNGIQCDWDDQEEDETNGQNIENFFETENKKIQIKKCESRFFTNHFIKRVESFD